MRFVRSIAIGSALLLAFAFTAGAQLVGPEIVSAPFSPANSSALDDMPTTAIVAVGESAFVAWVETVQPPSSQQRVRLARLDRQLHATAVRDVPLLNATDDATMPSIATDGKHILVVWKEGVDIVGMALFDRDLNLIAGPSLLITGNYRAVATRLGDEFAVAVKNILFYFTSETFSTPHPVWTLPYSVNGVAANPTYGLQAVAIYWYQDQVCWRTCVPLDRANIYFNTVNQSAVSWQPSTPVSFRSIAGGGPDTLVIWRTERLSATGELDAALFSPIPEKSLPTAIRLDVLTSGDTGVASATWDGERYAIVWEAWTSGFGTDRNHGIAFATIENGAITRRTIVIDGPDEETRPSIVSLGPGRYIVAYEKVSSGEHRIAGRLVSLQQTVRRRPSGD